MQAVEKVDAPKESEQVARLVAAGVLSSPPPADRRIDFTDYKPVKTKGRSIVDDILAGRRDSE